MTLENRKPLGSGKLPADMLTAFLAGLGEYGPEVVVGAAVGEDAAVIEVGERYLVLASDPVTLSAEPGSFAVQINANDVAVMGAEPRWLLATILLPRGSDESQAQHVMEDLLERCRSLGVALIGGHTEVTASVTRPVVAATMVGEVPPDRLVRSSGARAGDALLLAGPLAIEGTAILAAEFGDELRACGVPGSVIDEGRRLARDRGISVLPATRALTSAVLPHAMHDPTEGGLLAAVRELAIASQCGVRLDADRVPVLPACRLICEALGLDPFGLLASGSLLAALDPHDVDAAMQVLTVAAIEAHVIGEILSVDQGLHLHRAGRAQPLPAIDRDELARWIGTGEDPSPAPE
jgi:hydrogenase maturation factor